MSAEYDTPTVLIPGIAATTERTIGDVQLYDDQERRAQAIERAAAAAYSADTASLLAIADYVITGHNPIRTPPVA